MPYGRGALLACIGLLGFTFLLSCPSALAWPDDPLANVVLCDATSDQADPVGVTDGAGGAIVTWRDYRAGNYDIYAQRISATGEVQWAANGVALCAASYGQGPGVIASDSAGGAIVAWSDYRNGVTDVYAQRISSDGVPQWATDGVAICTATNDQFISSIIADGLGGAIITWSDYRSSDLDVYAQRISSTGVVRWTADGVAICTATRNQSNPCLAPADTGAAIVAWVDARGSSADLYAQSISSSGVVQWAANGVSFCTAASAQMGLRLVSDGAGGAIAAWMDYRSTYSDIYAQRIASDGTAQWTADGVALCAASNGQISPVLTTDGANGAIAAWQDGRAGNSDVYAQRVSGDGVVQWTADGVAVGCATGEQYQCAIIPDGANGAIIGWQDWRSTYMDIYAQRVTSDGTAQWTTDGVPVCSADKTQYQCTLVPDGANGAIVAWQDLRGSSNWDIYAQRVWSDGSTPVLVSLVDAVVAGDQVELTWFSGGDPATVATVYRSTGGAWSAIGTVTPDGTGYLRYTDAIDAAVARVGYRLGIVDAGVESYFGETWVDLPRSEFALDGVSPNPTRGGAMTVRFTLSSATPARLELVDVTGRCVLARDAGTLGTGTHTLDLGDGGQLAPGVYLVRLRQGTNVRVARVAVTR